MTRMPDPVPTVQPRLAYLVSSYPAISHTFILREVQRLRALGHDISTASINRPDRPEAQRDAAEQAEAQATYCVKADGAQGAVTALTYWAKRDPGALARTLWWGLCLSASQRSIMGFIYAVEATMVGHWMAQKDLSFLHVHFGNAGATVGMLVKRLTGCHLSYTIHGPDEFDDIPGQYLRTKVEQADDIICISGFVRGQLMRISEPEQWPKLQVCRLGVDPGLFTYGLREAHPGPTRLLCVGRLTPAKCQVLLVQACARLRDLGEDFHLTMVGTGPDLGRVEQAVHSMDMQGRITLTGALTQAQVREQLAAADVFVLPSLAEGIPVVLMEAMSSGVPCVTTPVNGIPELIQHGRSGLLAVPGDLDSLVEQLREIIGDRALQHRLAITAREKIETDFDLDKNVRKLGKIFERFAQE